MAWTYVRENVNQFLCRSEMGNLITIRLTSRNRDVALDVHSMLPSSKEIIVTTPHPTAAFVAARAGQWQNIPSTLFSVLSKI